MQVSWQQRYPSFFDIAIACAQPEDVYQLATAAGFTPWQFSDGAIDAVFDMLRNRRSDPDMIFPRLEHDVMLGWEQPELEHCAAVFALSRVFEGNRIELLFHAIGSDPAIVPSILVTLNWGSRLHGRIAPTAWPLAEPLLAAVQLERLSDLPLAASSELEVEKRGTNGRCRSILKLREEIRLGLTTSVFVSGLAEIEN